MLIYKKKCQIEYFLVMMSSINLKLTKNVELEINIFFIHI